MKRGLFKLDDLWTFYFDLDMVTIRGLNAKLLYQLVEPWPIIALTPASLVELFQQ